MYRRRVLLVALVAFALVAAGCSKGSSESSKGLEGSQPDSTTVSDVLDNVKSEIDNGLLTDSMKTVFPNLDLPSESTDAINKLSGELTDLAKTEPKKVACAGVSVLEGIVSGVTEAATKLSSEAQAVADKALEPIEAGLSEVANQKDYKSNCAGASNDSILSNQSAFITQLLKPIVGDWSPLTPVCLVLDGLLILTGVIFWISILIAAPLWATPILRPLAILPLIVALVAFVPNAAVGFVMAVLGCPDPTGSKMQSKIPTLDTEELLRLAKKANSQ